MNPLVLSTRAPGLCRQVSRIISLHVPGCRELQAAIGHDPKAKYKIKLLVTDVKYYNL